MSVGFNGEAIARQRIAEEAAQRRGWLDLGGLGLTEMPDSLFALRHLRRLNLGNRLKLSEDGWEYDPSTGYRNTLDDGLDQLETMDWTSWWS